MTESKILIIKGKEYTDIKHLLFSIDDEYGSCIDFTLGHDKFIKDFELGQQVLFLSAEGAMTLKVKNLDQNRTYDSIITSHLYTTVVSRRDLTEEEFTKLFVLNL